MNAILSWITRFVEPLGPKLFLALALLLALTLLARIYLGRHAAYNDMNVAPQTLRSVRLVNRELSGLFAGSACFGRPVIFVLETVSVECA